ncbi:hypothetical protein [Bacteroides sp. UBA939]|uniref:hypothetical protein n=1 Tax=Bacteroides sp. UBA939 TaxID=1946092 RepID=UPI0025BC348C|nr:hypothetical protein [Bacteroides sp. UBA939]
MSSLVFSKNNLFFIFLVMGYIFGVILYDCIGFKYTDELLALFLAFFAALILWERKNWREAIPIMTIICIFLFYTIYSFIIHSNVSGAIIKDLLIQIKPFIGFYCAYLIAPQLTSAQKRFICILCLIIGGLIVIVGLTNHIYPVFGHPSRLATAATATAFLFLYCSTYTWSDVLVFVLLLSAGIFSTRSKFYGFWLIAVFLLIYSKSGGKLRFSWKDSGIVFCLFLLVVWLVRDKIILYYVDGMMNSREMWSRPAMMLTSGRILYDYFPFGSGLGSFGSYASGEYYSAIYEIYGIDQLWGISRSTGFFICDAFYPSLAQFGIAGVILYITFWVLILRKGYCCVSAHNRKQWMILLLSFLFFLIEGIADTTFTHNRGLFILIITAITLKEMKYSHETSHGHI